MAAVLHVSTVRPANSLQEVSRIPQLILHLTLPPPVHVLVIHSCFVAAPRFQCRCMSRLHTAGVAAQACNMPVEVAHTFLILLVFDSCTCVQLASLYSGAPVQSLLFGPLMSSLAWSAGAAWIRRSVSDYTCALRPGTGISKHAAPSIR
jgi:hypothetical protein